MKARTEASRYPRLVAAVLFLAVSAYGGAALFGGLSGQRSAPVRQAALVESLPLRGVALREERQLRSLLPARSLPEAGTRIPAGGRLTELADGSVLTAERSALFFPDCDGYEDLPLPSGETLETAAVEALLEERPLRLPGTLGRLVTGDAWYFLALARETALPETGSRVTLRLEGVERSLPARLTAVSAPEAGQMALLLRLTESDAQLLRLRKCQGELILSVRPGLSLPTAAVWEDDTGRNCVSVLTAEGRKAVAVELIRQRGDVCLVQPAEASAPLEPGDRVLLETKSKQREG